MVSRDARVLFVHVQKTGGSTMDELLARALPDAERVSGLKGGRHAGLGQALARHPEFRDFWTFGFVRNPWARLLSWYAMIERAAAGAAEGDAESLRRVTERPFWRRVIADHPTFESFVLHGLDDVGRLHKPQIDYLTAPGRRADFIGRTENYAADLAAVFAHFGAAPPEEEVRRNAGPSVDYRERYTPAMRDKVADVFARDLDEFGYTFDAS